MFSKVTRRQLAIGLAATTALAAQAPPAAVPATPEEELKAIRDQVRRNSDALAKVQLSMTTEPAFVFKA